MGHLCNPIFQIGYLRITVSHLTLVRIWLVREAGGRLVIPRAVEDATSICFQDWDHLDPTSLSYLAVLILLCFQNSPQPLLIPVFRFRVQCLWSEP